MTIRQLSLESAIFWYDTEDDLLCVILCRTRLKRTDLIGPPGVFATIKISTCTTSMDACDSSP